MRSRFCRRDSAPSVQPDISPTRGDWTSCGLSPIANVARRTEAQKLPISPLVGEMSGRTEGGAKDRGSP
ncbi:hypothetical protein EN925_20995 [Mesorhizobium sp. M7A.F.Ca.US.006.04.2.1]|nr:hypothetical protein EN990_29345 [Mesorhizobium sp. M7A.F.Ca.US.005.03.1.1]RUY13929.1 hypothetical protein EN991_20085 [Mesorhizobium sp. M7A.F.Ca.US.005.03.2.1]RUY26223.1 hypothetical protein EN979_20490 [Mesorhizobium sp. M7A.F.Ca.US.001.04.2.1]RUY35011.1 hypothetical protein EN978_33415 [Mesorhizobium sp. M7A.F.Ca.US.001.04.1.1]RVA03856.1 hypothetical protein EN938_14695 [Mesorhizobium sp. M7A.F.Ca.US.001.02.1.1]RVA07461.1 hypothetical protein EN932_27300 [Mesorhizobium sp. M7A.F.Ca.US.0